MAVVVGDSKLSPAVSSFPELDNGQDESRSEIRGSHVTQKSNEHNAEVAEPISCVVTVVHPHELQADFHPVPTTLDLSHGGRRGFLDNQLSVAIILLILAATFVNPVALCCAMTAFVFAFQAASANKNGDEEKAIQCHRRAQCCNSAAAIILAALGCFVMMMLLTFIIGALVLLLIPLLIVVVVLALAMTLSTFGH